MKNILNKKEEQEMINVTMNTEKNVLVIKVDLSKRNGPSKSGKTTTVGTTSGFTSVDHSGKKYLVSLNVNIKE
jgi:ABC-type multidrug transport system ATPase subunit